MRLGKAAKAHPWQVVVIQHIHLDGEVVEGQAGHIQRGGVGHGGIVPEEDSSMARPGAEASDCQDVRVADVHPLHMHTCLITYCLAIQ